MVTPAKTLASRENSWQTSFFEVTFYWLVGKFSISSFILHKLLIFKKDGSKENLTVGASKLVFYILAYLFWCSSIYQTAIIFKPIIFANLNLFYQNCLFLFNLISYNINPPEAPKSQLITAVFLWLFFSTTHEPTCLYTNNTVTTVCSVYYAKNCIWYDGLMLKVLYLFAFIIA